jgi:type I restriction enzyme M protein
MTAPALVQKLRNYCNILGDDGLSYGGYVEVRAARAFTFFLSLKMADELSSWGSPLAQAQDDQLRA